MNPAESYPLSEVLKHRNVDGKMYLCDVDRWLGGKVSLGDCEEIRDKLMEIYDKTA